MSDALITRYADKKMAENFSETRRAVLFRRLWVALAESQRELGLNISAEQIDELKKFTDKPDLDAVAEYEKITRHDVMAHIRAYGDQAPLARPIIHLGATSCFVTDNADLIIYRDALTLIRDKIVNILDKLKNFALKYKDLPCLGFTHLQPAQLTTVGKRAALWAYDLTLDLYAVEAELQSFRLRGLKGTTGTQASFLELFGGDHDKVKELERRVIAKVGFSAAFSVTGQTYTRKFDYRILALLSQIAQSAYKFSGDLRLLQHMKEVEEPFGKGQVGSSAMAYKRNPMRAERISALCRYVVSLPVNTAVTAGTQWLERTLDDSANRRLSIPQAFLALSGALNIYMDISENMVVYPKMIARHVAAELPFMATENILMEASKRGGDRQDLHECIKNHSQAAAARVKEYGEENDLFKRLKAEPLLAAISGDFERITDPSAFVGRAPAQTEELFCGEITEILTRYAHVLGERYSTEI